MTFGIHAVFKTPPLHSVGFAKVFSYILKIEAFLSELNGVSICQKSRKKSFVTSSGSNVISKIAFDIAKLSPLLLGTICFLLCVHVLTI